MKNKELLIACIGTVLHAIFFGVIAASILHLQAQTSIKILIISLIALWLISVNRLGNVLESHGETQTKVLYYLRSLFISNEMQRLHPDNKEPSRDLLLRDLQIEMEQKDIEQSFGRGSDNIGFKAVIGFIYLVIFAIATTIIFIFWNIVEQLIA